MILLPSNLDNVELNRTTKIFINSIKNRLSDEYYCLLNLNILRKSANFFRINVIISKRGIFIFKLKEEKSLDENIINKIYKPFYQELSSILKDRFDHNSLKVENKFIIPINIKFIIPNINSAKIDTSNHFIKDNMVFKKEFYELRKKLSEFLKNRIECGSNFDYINKNISQDKINIFIHRLAPEYTIPIRDSKNKETDDINELSDQELQKNDEITSALLLDEDQINYVNNISTGNQRIIACAGSGKSVLLIAKTFKMAKEYPKKNFLITCFNRNLKDYYRWQISKAGLTEKNVDCMTFHALCKNILESNYNRKYNKIKENHIFDVLSLARNDKVDSNFRYYGIFVDEIQLFNPIWYKVTYQLLKDKENRNHIFVISGDVSQNFDVKENTINSIKPWMIDDKENEYPNFKGKDANLRLEKNYRNTIEIDYYIKNFIKLASEFCTKIGIDLKNDDEIFLRGTPFKNGDMPQVCRLNKKTNKGEAEKIIEKIEYLFSAGYNYSDISVILYNRKYRKKLNNWDESIYNIHNTLCSKLENKSIDYSVLTDTKKHERKIFMKHTGVSIITSQSSLGIDYNNVILGGLKSMGAYHRTKKEKRILNGLDDKKKKNIINNIHTLYTTLTRAKENLYVILSDDPGESIYSSWLYNALELTEKKLK